MGSIDQAKSRMGYVNAAQRPRCRNCYYVEQVVNTGAYNDLWPWRCKKGGFGVTVQAVCNQHQPVSTTPQN